MDAVTDTADKSMVKVQSSHLMKNMMADRAARDGCSTSDVVRSAIRHDLRRPRSTVLDTERPFVTVRLDAKHEDHLRRVSSQLGVSYGVALEAMLCGFLFSDEPTAFRRARPAEAPAPAMGEAADEPGLFD